MRGQTTSGNTSKDKKWRSSKDTSNRPEVRKGEKAILSTTLPFPDGPHFILDQTLRAQQKINPYIYKHWYYCLESNNTYKQIIIP